MSATMLETDSRAVVCPDARERLLASHLPLVRHVARRMQRSLGDHVELDDLVSAGTLGLMQAAASFDASRGLAFSTYAAPRIQGAILDELRRWDHAPRTTRKRSRDVSRTEHRLGQRLGRTPTETEVAAELGIPRDTLWSWRSAAEHTRRVALDQPVRTAGSGAPVSVEHAVASPGSAIEDDLDRQDQVRMLVSEIASLREQERVVLTLYFFEQLKLHQIAQVLGLTESRISQIRMRALATLRTRLEHLG